MKNTKVYVDFITEKLKKLLSIDSPTGYTKDAVAWLKQSTKRWAMRR